MDRDTSRIRLVLLDDHADAREALSRRAARHPRLEVVGATADPDVAAKMVREQRPDVVLVDTKRGDHRGGEALAQLCRLEAAIRPCVVVHVALLTNGEDEAARLLGADAVILKQLSTAVLADELAALLRAGTSRAVGDPSAERPAPRP
jgi:two-component system chemotaxis response regulator CheB